MSTEKVSLDIFLYELPPVESHESTQLRISHQIPRAGGGDFSVGKGNENSEILAERIKEGLKERWLTRSIDELVFHNGMRNGSPFWSEDYLKEESLEHKLSNNRYNQIVSLLRSNPLRLSYLPEVSFRS
jgi:hypothetical protein